MSEVTAIATRLKELRTTSEQITEEEDTLWKRFFEICDDLAGEKENYKAVIPEIGWAIAREMHQASPKLLVENLKKELTEEGWKLISRPERVLDMSKLEYAIDKGLISTDLVNEHTESKNPVAHKKFRAATAQEIRDANG